MKFSNGVRVNLKSLKRQGVVSVEWQAVVLEEEERPVGNEEELRQTLAQPDAFGGPSAFGIRASTNGFSMIGTEMALTTRDDLLGVPVTTEDPHYNAHAITLHSQPVGLQPTSSSLILASDSIDEVVKIYLQQAQAYCDEDQWEKAFNACQEVLKVAPATAEAYKFLGKILQQQGRPTDAMGFYAKAITLRPNFPEVYSNLGSLYAQKGEWEEAVNYYKKAIERDPQLAIAYLNLAKIWKQLDRKESELNCLATAFRLQPDLGSAEDHFKLAQSLEAANNREGAVLFYQQAVKQDAKMVGAYQRLADLLEEGGDWQGAAECYRQVLKLNAEAEAAKAAKSISGKSVSGSLPVKLSPEGQTQMKKLLQASKTRKLLQTEAASDGSSAVANGASSSKLALSPAEAENLSQTDLAQRYAAAKDWGSAIECMQKAIAQEPQSASLYRNLARLFEQSDESKRAAEAWYRSFVLEPNWPDAQQCYSLGRVLARQGNADAAMRCYRQSIQLQPEFLLAREALDTEQNSNSRELLTKGRLVGSDSVLQQTTVTIKK